MCVFSALWRLKQEVCECQATLGYITRLGLKKEEKGRSREEGRSRRK
jgi:hypothetical protein